MEEIIINPNPCKLEMKRLSTTKGTKEQLNCPRCKSNNTKFCFYNNYSLTQPRYFCKSCRRYWTKGGSLRNVPMGGASRKTRSKSTTISSSSHHLININNNNPKLPNYPSSQNKVGLRDLNLADHNLIPKVENVNNNIYNNNNCGIGFRGLSCSFIPNLMPNNSNNNGNLGTNSNSQYPSNGFSLDDPNEFKPSLGINCVDGRNLLLHFQELNQQCGAPNEGDNHQNERQQWNNISTGYWTGMLGGGSLL